VTADTERRHPWDEMVDSGYGWTDQLVSQWDGKSVYVTRNIDSPEEQVEHIRIVFPDGSVLYIETDGHVPVTRALDAGAVEHWTHTSRTDAYRVVEQWIGPLYDNASIKEMDTDL
jgi:hypothetical protein